MRLCPRCCTCGYEGWVEEGDTCLPPSPLFYLNISQIPHTLPVGTNVWVLLQASAALLVMSLFYGCLNGKHPDLVEVPAREEFLYAKYITCHNLKNWGGLQVLVERAEPLAWLDKAFS
ncbi:Hypothetical predicted protein [Podarcis lilfordi]|uniref:Uncharacterized protein n=1 Tax=Podarcis lilfordi TaxID=74358 RepID=A0AA35NW98_9SAUR|nr:Hypothetical predicted protein [Podarcis lilfordi]